MAFKYINAAISGEYQKIMARLIDDPETIDLTDTPTKNLPDGVAQTGYNLDPAWPPNGILTGSTQSIEFDGADDFLKLPTLQGLGTEILLEDIGEYPVKQGSTANNIALEAWVKLDSSITGIDKNSEFFEVTIQRNSVSSTTGYDGNYMARTIYAVSAEASVPGTIETDGDGNTLSAHFIDFQFATGSTFAYSLTSNNNITLNDWHHIWCEYTVTGADKNPRFTPSPRGWMRIYIDGTLNREEPLSQLNWPGTHSVDGPMATSTLPFPATADAVSYGFDRAISFDGKLDEMRLWINTGTAESIEALSNKGNIGIQPEDFSMQEYATEVKRDFAPSAEYLAAWWRFESVSAVELFASVADSIQDITRYGHSGTPQNFTGSIDFSEETTIVAGNTVSGLTNAVSGQINLTDLIGGTYDHGGLSVIHDNQNELRMEEGTDNLVTCASNIWAASGGASVNHDVLNIWLGSSAYSINTGAAGQGAVHTIDYSHLLFDKNEYTLSLRLLLTSGSPSAQVTFTLGSEAAKVATTAFMNTDVWEPVVIRNIASLTGAETHIKGEVSILGVTNDSSTDDGALFRVDALQIHEGSYPSTFVGPQQIRKGGEISWAIGE